MFCSRRSSDKKKEKKKKKRRNAAWEDEVVLALADMKDEGQGDESWEKRAVSSLPKPTSPLPTAPSKVAVKRLDVETDGPEPL